MTNHQLRREEEKNLVTVISDVKNKECKVTQIWK